MTLHAHCTVGAAVHAWLSLGHVHMLRRERRQPLPLAAAASRHTCLLLPSSSSAMYTHRLRAQLTFMCTAPQDTAV